MSNIVRQGHQIMILCLCVLLVIPLTLTNAAERGSSCVTPNGESAVCGPISTCQMLVDALKSNNQTSIEFAVKSQCGYDTEPLVCCGSTIVTTEPFYFGLFTKTPPTTPPPVKKTHIVDLSVISHNTLPDRTICGLERETPRLIGATLAGIDEFPWMALIGYRDDNDNHVGFKCGGTLINNRFVLTAAHCLFTRQERFYAFQVRLGEWKLSSEVDCVETLAIENCADPVVDLKIQTEIPHPYFSSRNGNNDIALVKLEKDVIYTDFIRPICLPPFDLPVPEPGTIMTVCGWGATENGSQADVKSKLEIPLVSNTECAKTITMYTLLAANQVCAGGIEGKDACKGDSGGPLMRTYFDDTSQWYQEGVVSRGRGCGKKGYPGVYTRISRYIKWILNNILD